MSDYIEVNPPKIRLNRDNETFELNNGVMVCYEEDFKEFKYEGTEADWVSSEQMFVTRTGMCYDEDGIYLGHNPSLNTFLDEEDMLDMEDFAKELNRQQERDGSRGGRGRRRKTGSRRDRGGSSRRDRGGSSRRGRDRDDDDRGRGRKGTGRGRGKTARGGWEKDDEEVVRGRRRVDEDSNNYSRRGGRGRGRGRYVDNTGASDPKGNTRTNTLHPRAYYSLLGWSDLDINTLYEESGFAADGVTRISDIHKESNISENVSVEGEALYRASDLEPTKPRSKTGRRRPTNKQEHETTVTQNVQVESKIPMDKLEKIVDKLVTRKLNVFSNSMDQLRTSVEETIEDVQFKISRLSHLIDYTDLVRVPEGSAINPISEFQLERLNALDAPTEGLGLKMCMVSSVEYSNGDFSSVVDLNPTKNGRELSATMKRYFEEVVISTTGTPVTGDLLTTISTLPDDAKEEVLLHRDSIKEVSSEEFNGSNRITIGRVEKHLLTANDKMYEILEGYEKEKVLTLKDDILSHMIKNKISDNREHFSSPGPIILNIKGIRALIILTTSGLRIYREN